MIYVAIMGFYTCNRRIYRHLKQVSGHIVEDFVVYI